jgi:hypothetical protein
MRNRDLRSLPAMAFGGPKVLDFSQQIVATGRTKKICYGFFVSRLVVL